MSYFISIRLYFIFKSYPFLMIHVPIFDAVGGIHPFQILRGTYTWSNGLVVKALDSQSRSPVFKTTEWLQGRLSPSSFRGR